MSGEPAAGRPPQWRSTRELTKMGTGITLKQFAQWAANGLVRCRALHMRDQNEESRDAPVPARVWKLYLESGVGRREFDPQAASMLLRRYNHGPTIDVEIQGLQFDRAELEKVAGERAGELSLPETMNVAVSTKGARPTDRRGSPGKPEAWTALWLAVIQLERDGRLNLSGFSTQKALRDELLSMIGEGLSETSIKPTVRSIWNRFVESPAPRPE
jgi:hypothetical protein